ncbi:hypothetical protein B0O99DRAFT_672309 [Bisporella sp. PMI_857]|nr:hypothetical protein B0O99DRAFT_672309 [Bisporella sp. PMI_857]
MFSNSMQSIGASIPPGGGFQIATDLSREDSAQASYIGEDGRLTLLRGELCECTTLNSADPKEIHTMFRTMAAAPSSGSSASIPQENLRLLPIILRTLIRYYKPPRRINKPENDKRKASRLSTAPLFPRLTRYKARIDSLQREVELLKDAKSKVKFKNDSLKRDIREVERSYANIKAQKDSLKAELDELKLRATSDSGIKGSSEKRRRLE